MSPVPAKTIKEIFSLEGGDAPSAAERADAASRVYEKLLAQLSPLLGVNGVRALLGRSARLRKAEFAFLADPTVVESAERLHAALRELAPDAASAAAEGLFGTFCALITTFIGERLTAEVLRTAWPPLDELASKEIAK